jgi:hypothetical protein
MAAICCLIVSVVPTPSSPPVDIGDPGTAAMAAPNTGLASASLLQTCKLNDVAPQTRLMDTLARIAAGQRIGAIAELLPWAWKARQGAD